ncbi:type I restriction enzyme, R subunit [Geoalkalibacter ferrihydriticus]|uniref:Type I restriction enzyme endonuclease subunit n=2 Tax=Geoalkalibacter ferrihydriticus TaxID=392333 RepID=A0A0C2HTR2_9BACT|nr:type I restriction endonuclease subunit R [Geoalkalibacter ferrihydriticus]KIH78190.1 DEAD/DEAH box helicase [Geoalkalibacter ferrihydriticus DSM 17813]SDM12591.1 type I restriction enzyme, R subunit [Geoalkalibacter ferrihydriticus]
MITEDHLEQLCLDWFRTGGYATAFGPDLAPDGGTPERRDYQQTILTERLLAALQKINPHIPFAILEDAAQLVTKPESPVLIHNNRAFHKLLLEGVPVEYRDNDDIQNDHVQLIDFQHVERNQFLVVNQFTVKGCKQLRRPDLVVFINGLPIALIELKNPADVHADIWKAYDQVQTYKDEVPDLFVCNEALVVSDGLTARIGSLTASKERFLPWRTLRNEDDKPLLEYELEKVIKGFFDRTLLLDYLRYFILFEQDDGQLIKKIAGYHQFHAVREAVRVTLIASATVTPERVSMPRATWGQEVQPGSRKAGVVWHTQGSGKSITMCCYAGKLLQQPEMNNPTIVVVTDRNDLDGQLFSTFSNAQELLRQTPVQADSREDLRELLAARQSGGIIFTTVQKFSLLNGEEKHPPLSTRSNIVVISDEAHRSQYGFKARLDTKTGAYVYGYAKHMRDAIPQASFIGFTGTPISQEDKDTRAVFGDYVSIYDIQDAVDDGATVPIYYESRLAKLDINRAEIEALNDEVEEVIEDEEDLNLRERTKSKWAALEKLVGAEPRLKEVAEDLVNHFEARTAVIDGKGMIVCMSREICVHLYNEIVRIRPKWHNPDPEKGAIKIVMTGSAADRALMQPHIYNNQTKKRLERRFKDPRDELKLVIVRDMWLTGFDCPSCHTMYVDKPMRGHNLMQAIARVNRVFKDKPGGLVVDYIGIANELKQALKVYINAQGKGVPTLAAEEALAVLLEKIDVVRGLFHGFDYSDYPTRAHQILVLAANHILGLREGKKRFLDAMAAITRAFSLCGTLDEAEPLRKEIAFFAAIRAAIVKHTTVDSKLTEEQKNSALKQILDNAVIAEGVADVFSLAGLDKPNIALLSDEFLEDVRNMKSRNLALELLEKLLRDTIKARTRNNLVLEQKFSERLLASLNRYHARAIETAQVIEELIQMAKDFQKALKRDEELGLNTDEVAFYDALARNESAVRELGDDILKIIAVEITEKLRKSTSVDWQVRENVRAKLRNLVRRTLRKWKYPPDRQEDAVNLVLKQAEVLCAWWV